MAYSTVTMVRQALAPGTWVENPEPDLPANPTNTAADLSDEQLTDAIAEADSFIDAYIGGRYVTPVAGTDGVTGDLPPHPLDYWSRNIAAYNATLAYREGQDFADTDPVARRYNATILALTAVRNGQAVLNITPNTGDSSTAGAGTPINTYDGTMFSPDDFNLVPASPLWPRRYPSWPGDGLFGVNWE